MQQKEKILSSKKRQKTTLLLDLSVSAKPKYTTFLILEPTTVKMKHKKFDILMNAFFLREEGWEESKWDLKLF